MNKTTPISVIGAALALAIASTSPALAQAERKVGVDVQSDVAVTIYNRDLALIKELRKVELKKGLNRLAFIDVSGRMRPETAILRGSAPGRIRLIEQNFNFDIMTRRKLLEKSVGRTVRIVKVHPTTGAETVVEAKVLSALKGVVLKIGDRIETGMPGRIVFDRIPPNMRARPTLVIDLESTKAGSDTLELSYLSRGLRWRADYVGELNADDTKLQLNGWVTLFNRSGTTYKNARLQLVAGDVHQVRRRLGRGRYAGESKARRAPRASMRRERFFDYHLYTLGRPTTVAHNQIKQVALMSASSIPVVKEYRLSGTRYYYRGRYAGEVKRPVNVWLALKNDKASNLGLPLPKGIVRVYKRDSKGKALFAGEDRIGHTPEGNDVRLKMGKAFDVTASRRQTDYVRRGYDNRTYVTAHEITLKNARPKAVTVVVREPVPGDWTMVEQSQQHKRVSSNLVEWRVTVPAKGQAKLAYRVRIRF